MSSRGSFVKAIGSAMKNCAKIEENSATCLSKKCQKHEGSSKQAMPSSRCEIKY